jgi:hypothetical protein
MDHGADSRMPWMWSCVSNGSCDLAVYVYMYCIPQWKVKLSTARTACLKHTVVRQEQTPPPHFIRCLWCCLGSLMFKCHLQNGIIGMYACKTPIYASMRHILLSLSFSSFSNYVLFSWGVLPWILICTRMSEYVCNVQVVFITNFWTESFLCGVSPMGSRRACGSWFRRLCASFSSSASMWSWFSVASLRTLMSNNTLL